MKTTVVNLKKESYDVYIGRAGKGQKGTFGNPYVIENGWSRDRAILEFEKYFVFRMSVDDVFRRAVDGLRGKKLGCFCKPLRCHGDVIADYLNHAGTEWEFITFRRDVGIWSQVEKLALEKKVTLREIMDEMLRTYLAKERKES